MESFSWLIFVCACFHRFIVFLVIASLSSSDGSCLRLCLLATNELPCVKSRSSSSISFSVLSPSCAVSSWFLRANSCTLALMAVL